MGTCGAMDFEIVPVREGLRVFVPMLWLVRDVATQHGGNGTIETLDLGVSPRVVR